MPKKGLDKKGDVGLKDKQKHKVEPPKNYKVVLHNDDYTPMDFVAQLLMQLFHKDAMTAKAITQHVHTKGKGIAGIYSREIAETKTSEAISLAQNYGHPLLADFEPE
jgi:ATP-dependent Clp protease adaptor protein ClpS